MQSNEHIDVMVPKGYDPSGSARYRVLYLLHGAFGNHSDWVDHGVESLIGNRRLIVVMPDDGPDGSYSDWYGMEAGQPGPAPAWASFHLRELVPWIQAHYWTVPGRWGRVIAGLSSGGGGAMKYAAENPGMFAAAGEFSGAVDVNLPGYYDTAEVLWNVTYLPGLGPPGHCTWGDPAKHPVIWHDNDATPLASNLKGTSLFLASGNGKPGPYDSPAAPNDPTESTVWRMNQAFDAALDRAGIRHTTYFYGAGTHSWPYWLRDLRHFLRWLPPIRKTGARPKGFSVRSTRVPFSAWGWTFRPHRRALEFTYLRGVGRHGLKAVGSGTLKVRTAPIYRRRARYAVDAGGRHRLLTASRTGRLRFPVDLGPSHTTEQAAAPRRPPAAWHHTSVRIRKPRHGSAAQ